MRREHTNLEALLSIPVGLLSALEAQGELRENSWRRSTAKLRDDPGES